MTSNPYPELSDILGSYFHQDWHDEFASDGDALRAIIGGESPERLQAAASELDRLLHAGLTESELRSLATVELGCFFEPESRSLSWEEWLWHVKSRFQRSG